MNTLKNDFERQVYDVMYAAQTTFGTKNDSRQAILIKRALVFASLFIMFLVATLFLVALHIAAPNMQPAALLLITLQIVLIAYYCGRFSSPLLLVAVERKLRMFQ